MTKQTRATKATATVAAFSVDAWGTRLDQAAMQHTSAGKVMLDLMLEARGLIEVDTARERLTHAFGQAYAATYGVTFEEAAASKAVKNRVSDGLAVLKAEVLPASMPGHIQGAAAACRKANPSGRKVAPRQSKGPAATVEVGGLAMLEAALNMLKAEAGDNETVLSLVGDLIDLAGELSEALAAEATADKAAKGAKKAA